MVGVGGAAAGAVKSCPAIAARLASVHVARGKLALLVGVGHALPHVAQLVGLVTHKLMAGVQVAPGGHGHVFGAGAAAGNALVDAGAAGQVDHIVIEGEGLARLFPLQHQGGQLFILILYDLHIRLGQLGGVPCSADHGLHGKLGEAQVQHLLDIL